MMLRSFALAVLCLPFLLAPARAAAPEWKVGFSQSALGFTGTVMGAKFKGTIQKYAPAIRFDPDHPETCAIAVDIDMTSISTGDKDRDKTSTTPEWLDPAHFPKAQFKADSCKKTGDKAYEADGTLMIKGVSAPIAVLFTLDLIAKADPPQAHVKGTATLDRSKFNLGTGEWTDTSVVANEVTVEFDLVAYQGK
jgi:polyisoprenoid-binding protein YceI